MYPYVISYPYEAIQDILNIIAIRYLEYCLQLWPFTSYKHL